MIISNWKIILDRSGFLEIGKNQIRIFMSKQTWKNFSLWPYRLTRKTALIKLYQFLFLQIQF
jgi:hypothetical protein